MKVKEFLTPERWAKGDDVYLDNRDCLLTAICRCYEDSQVEWGIKRRVREAVNGSLIDWNDAPERTFQEVKALVEKLDI